MLGRKMIYVRYNNVAKGIRLLDKKAILVYTEKFHASKSFWKIYPLNFKARKFEIFSREGLLIFIDHMINY